MDIKSIIIKKRNKQELTKDEIRHFIIKYNKGEITEAQAGALLTNIYNNGLTEDEITYFAVAMAETGEIMDFSDLGMDIVDKHSTGGVGDKATIILMPIVAALGIPMAKISSRGMGTAGGTIDKLESIPGYNAEIPIEDFKLSIKNCGIGLVNQSENLNPAENKMYKLRNEIACTDCIPIIAASLMSIKLSTGANKIVFEINYGSGNYIKTKEQAKKLAKILKIVGKKLGKGVNCLVTNLDEPLGYAIGHNLEMIEAIDAMKGKMAPDIKEVVTALGSSIINIYDLGKNVKINEELINKVLSDGSAYKKFVQMVVSQRRRCKLC